MEQTAVEWFWIHLEDTISKEYFDLFQQAKEIEKNQIENAFNYGNNNKWGSESQINSGEDYYKEKYQ